MKVLFCGSLLPKSYEGKTPFLSAAGNQFQNNLLSALKKKHQVKTLTYINYPLDLDIEQLKLDCKKEEIVPFLMQDSKLVVLDFRKKMMAYAEWADVVIVYNVSYAWFGLGKTMRKKGKKSVVVMADLTSWREVKKLPRKVYAYLCAKQFSQYQRAIMLSPGMGRYLNKKQDRILINGGIDWKKFEDIDKPLVSETVNIVYTGGLSSITGTDMMIEAFSNINDSNIQLYISGQGGKQENEVKQLCKIDGRIHYMGFVDRTTYYSLLKKAGILVSPRNMHYEQNLVNFPSKVLEYLATGRIIVSTKFGGWENYKDNIMFCDSSTESIQNKLKEAILLARKNPAYYYEKNRILAEKMDWNNNVDKFLS